MAMGVVLVCGQLCFGGYQFEWSGIVTEIEDESGADVSFGPDMDSVDRRYGLEAHVGRAVARHGPRSGGGSVERARRGPGRMTPQTAQPVGVATRRTGRAEYTDRSSPHWDR